MCAGITNKSARSKKEQRCCAFASTSDFLAARHSLASRRLSVLLVGFSMSVAASTTSAFHCQSTQPHLALHISVSNALTLLPSPSTLTQGMPQLGSLLSSFLACLLLLLLLMRPSTARRVIFQAFTSTPTFAGSPLSVSADAHRVADLLSDCKHVVAITGAGISTESGIPG